MTLQTPGLPLPFGDRRVAYTPVVGNPAAPSRLARAGRVVWRVLQDIGLRRGRGEILRLARDIEASRPELAAQLRDTARRGWL